MARGGPTLAGEVNASELDFLMPVEVLDLHHLSRIQTDPAELWFKFDSLFQLLLSTFTHERIRGIEDAPSLRAL
jgi:hypothetical protein